MIRRRKRKFIVFLIELGILAVVIVGLVFYSKLNQMEVAEVDDSKISLNDITEEELVEFTGYQTIALFALDNRELGQYDYGNSDVIMIINIDNDTKEMSLVSVYRDTYLDVSAADSDSATYRKANAAYAYGGPSQAINMLNTNLDLDIDNYVCVDFQAVSDAIDILGGVDIEIDSDAELKYLNDYIEATNDILGTSSPTIDSVGWHLMDGVQAVAYSRIRYTSGGDYKRALRQRTVLSAMMSKARDADFSQLIELIDAVFPMISTDLSQLDLLSMAQAMLGYDMEDSRGFPFERTDMTLQGAGSIVVPCDLVTNVSELHEFLFGTVDYQPSEQVQTISQYIVDKTGKTVGSAINDQFAYSDNYEDEDNTYDTEEETNYGDFVDTYE